MAHSVASLTVTRNAVTVLPQQLTALMGQVAQIDEIIVVDNASCDGTTEMLARDYPQVTVLKLPTNQGVGGGYAVGLEYAIHKKNHEWVWTLDQDSAPDSDCITELLAAYQDLNKNQPNKIGILAASPFNSSTGVTYPGWGWRHGMVEIAADDSAVQQVDLVISSGSLIRGEAVKQVGLPRQDFFIDFVDFEYCLRLRHSGYLIAVVRNARMRHSIGAPEKRRIFGKPWIWAVHAPWREYYKIRNQTFTIWHQRPTWRAKLYLLRKLFRHAVGVVLFDSRKIQRLSLMLIGLKDGIRGRLGIVIKPTL